MRTFADDDDTTPTRTVAMAVKAIVKDSALAHVLQTSGDARDQVNSLIRALRAEERTDDGPLEPSEISKQRRELFTLISHLRGLHRAVSFSSRNTKSQTAEARQEVDRLHLQLQNLYYEQRHLQGEIMACESYEHSYRQLPLIPADEFLSRFPEHTDDDENALMAARIEHEKTEREGLEQQRQELLRRKQKLMAENKKRKDDLADLDKDLERFIDAAKPIQKLFEKVV